MKQIRRLTVAILTVFAGLTVASFAADFELRGPDGRRILLKDDGTWQYVPQEARAGGENSKDGEAILALERMSSRDNGCRLIVRLENKLPYEIRSFVPYYSVYRADGVIYDTSSGALGFGPIRPGDAQNREIDFVGITCNAISRVQVGGGGRCQMGDLDRFSATPEQCLARVRVVQSTLVRFDK